MNCKEECENDHLPEGTLRTVLPLSQILKNIEEKERLLQKHDSKLNAQKLENKLFKSACEFNLENLESESNLKRPENNREKKLKEVLNKIQDLKDRFLSYRARKMYRRRTFAFDQSYPTIAPKAKLKVESREYLLKLVCTGLIIEPSKLPLSTLVNPDPISFACVSKFDGVKTIVFELYENGDLLGAGSICMCLGVARETKQLLPISPIIGGSKIFLPIKVFVKQEKQKQVKVERKQPEAGQRKSRLRAPLAFPKLRKHNYVLGSNNNVIDIICKLLVPLEINAQILSKFLNDKSELAQDNSCSIEPPILAKFGAGTKFQAFTYDVSSRCYTITRIFHCRLSEILSGKRIDFKVKLFNDVTGCYETFFTNISVKTLSKRLKEIFKESKAKKNLAGKQSINLLMLEHSSLFKLRLSRKKEKALLDRCPCLRIVLKEKYFQSMQLPLNRIFLSLEREEQHVPEKVSPVDAQRLALLRMSKSRRTRIFLTNMILLGLEGCGIEFTKKNLMILVSVRNGCFFECHDSTQLQTVLDLFVARNSCSLEILNTPVGFLNFLNRNLFAQKRVHELLSSTISFSVVSVFEEGSGNPVIDRIELPFRDVLDFDNTVKVHLNSGLYISFEVSTNVPEKTLNMETLPGMIKEIKIPGSCNVSWRTNIADRVQEVLNRQATMPSKQPTQKDISMLNNPCAEVNKKGNASNSELFCNKQRNNDFEKNEIEELSRLFSHNLDNSP
eukprot:snap_masked-scaffold_6-processed-gene-12.27-mRNA-1 protein AED:1.00 eAED:1.00 QI:0/0/0/0/1/1/2/0/729